MGKTVIIKEKVNYIIIKSFCLSKYTIKSGRMNHKLNMISTINITENRLVFRIY